MIKKKQGRLKIFYKPLVGLLFFGAIFFGAIMIFPLPDNVPILMYHFMGSKKDAQNSKNVVSTDSFRKQLEFLKLFRYKIISLDELYEIKTGKKDPSGREIVLTFDDANYTFERHAFKMLLNYQYPVTVFAISDNVKNELHGSMDAETLRTLLKSGFVKIEGHSKTHPLLSKLSAEQLKSELVDSKRDLEEMLDTPIRFLAYPSGDVDAKVVAAAKKAGYLMAFTTSRKKLKGVKVDLHSLTRVKISRTSDNLFVFWLKISGIYSFFKEGIF